jgi:SET domain-containing protein
MPTRKSPRLIVRRSAVHGRGAFANADLPTGEELIEYRGRRVRWQQIQRKAGYGAETGHTFLFTLDEDWVIDGGQGGNSARWLNHSCAPNCIAYLHDHESGEPSRMRVIIETLRPIRRGEELTYDYGIVLDEPHTPALKKIWACNCGAPACTGTMLKPKRKR